MIHPVTPLTQLPRTLADLCPEAAAVPSYYQLYMAALNGRIPTEMRGRRYFVRNDDLPVVASAFGLEARQPA